MTALTPTDHAEPATSAVVRRWQITLIAVGVVVLAIGAITLLKDVPPSRYLTIAVWLIAVIIVHDAIAAMVIFGVSVIARRVHRRIPFGVVLVVEAAVAVGVIVSVLVLPEIIRQALGTANPSVLPLNYLLNLLLFLAALAVVTLLAVATILGVRRVRHSRAASAREPAAVSADDEAGESPSE